MATINISSIMSRVGKFNESVRGKRIVKEKIDEYVKSGVSRTDGGGKVFSIKEMGRVADDMIELLKRCAYQAQLPDSVMRHFYSLTRTEPTKIGDDYKVDIYFDDDMSRMSLLITSGRRKGQRTGDGIDNIVALFNNGYSASNRVYGVWDGHEDLGAIASLQKREGKHFINQAVQEFNIKYGGEYDVQAYIIAPEYL